MYKVLHFNRTNEDKTTEICVSRILNTRIPKGYTLHSWDYVPMNWTPTGELVSKGSVIMVLEKNIQTVNETNGRKFRQGEE